jgi:hypothetical protein
MKTLRRIHLYLGVLYAPLLLFFIGTGWYQVTNPDRLKSAAEAETWVQKFRVIHTDQIYPRDGVRVTSPTLFQWLVYGMSAALIVATLVGLVLAFKSVKPRWPVWVTLFLGILLPIAALWLGSRPPSG